MYRCMPSLCVCKCYYFIYNIHNRFFKIIFQCYSETGCSPEFDTCRPLDRNCYLLDNNGYIVASERSSETGQFFGKIDGSTMKMMVNDKIYKKITIFDYQGVCFKREHEDDANSSSFLYTVSYQYLILTYITTYLSVGYQGEAMKLQQPPPRRLS